MDIKILLPQALCEDNVIGYIAQRYSSTPALILAQYMRQEGILKSVDNTAQIRYRLEDNEMAILRDMGLRPTMLEFS